MRRAVLAALVLGTAVAAAPAQAERLTYGSDLSLPATLAESHPRDWAAWPVATTPASEVVVPQSGEVAQVAVRGTIAAPRGLPTGFVFRVLILRPGADGALTVIGASTDLASRLTNLDPATVTTIDLQQFAERNCVLKGDVVAFATSGGYDPNTYPGGVPVQMFARTPDSSYGLFEEPEGPGSLMNGDVIRPTTVAGIEALLRVTVGTGNDARPTCRVAGPPSPEPTVSPSPSATPTPTEPGSGPVQLSVKASTRVRRSKVKLAVSCPGTVACAGRLALSRKSRPYGASGFELAAGQTKRIRIKLNRSARRALKRASGKLTVKVSASNGVETVTDHTVLRR